MDSANQPQMQIDHGFLKSVELEITRALQEIDVLDRGFQPAPQKAGDDSFNRLTANLAGWESRLAEMTARTSAVEAELSEQESALRSWFQVMGLAAVKLAEATNNLST